MTDCLFCLEHTGLYSLAFIEEFDSQGLCFSVISGLEYKLSRGLQRGKSDPIDAAGLAEYAYLRQENIKLFKPLPKNLSSLRHLLSMRAMHVRHRASYISRRNEQIRILKKTQNSLIFKSQERLINLMNKEIDRLDQAIESHIHADAELNSLFELLTSIKGVGPVLTCHMIVTTNCFTSFPNWRKFACYCGTAPFPNESGNKKLPNRISKIGASNTKTLLTLAARSAVMCDPELKSFYCKKLEKGKTKKNAINAVRNKLLARIFSVVKRGTPYVPLNQFAA